MFIENPAVFNIHTYCTMLQFFSGIFKFFCVRVVGYMYDFNGYFRAHHHSRFYNFFGFFSNGKQKCKKENQVYTVQTR